MIDDATLAALNAARPTQAGLSRRARARSLHISPRHGVAYVNNPKVACSSIKLALQRAELDAPDYIAANVHDHTASPLLTWPELEERPLVETLDGLFVFSVVRNPYARLRSAYLNKIVTGQKRGRPRKMAGFAADEVPGFEDFVLAVARQDPREQNPHWRRQTYNLSVGRIRFDAIARLETIARDWPRIAAHVGLPEALPRAGKASTAARLAFTPAMVAAVQTGFAEDFSAFGYPLEPPD